MSSESPEITEEESRMLRCIGQVVIAVASTVTDLAPRLEKKYGLSNGQVGVALATALALNATIGMKIANRIDFSDLQNFDQQILELLRQANQEFKNGPRRRQH